MWAALFGPKKPENEHSIQVKFVPGWTAGFIEQRSMQMPSKWTSDTEEWENVSSLAWQGIIRSIEEALYCPETEVIQSKIRRRGCVIILCLIGLILGFMCGFLMSFLGCTDGDPGVCATGLTFAVIFVVSLIGLVVGFLTMQCLLPVYARLVLDKLEKQLPRLQASNPNMRLDLMNINLQGAAQFDIRIRLKSRKERESETTEKPISERPQPLPQPHVVGVAALPQSLPSYWTNQDLRDGHFRQRCDVSAESRELFQVLLDETFKTRSTRDRQGKMPKRLRLVKCHRLEDSSMWSWYLSSLEKLKTKWPKCTPISDHYTAVQDSPEAQVGDVCTNQPLGGFTKRLDATLNEFYLMHGTSPDGALGITDGGFRLDLTGSHAGTMFGKGAYFAECSSKADEYSGAGEGIYEGVYAMLLCRVACGQMFRMLRPDHQLVDQVIGTTASAVLGDREASVGTYREFVVFDASQIYPEYVILYEREF